MANPKGSPLDSAMRTVEPSCGWWRTCCHIRCRNCTYSVEKKSSGNRCEYASRQVVTWSSASVGASTGLGARIRTFIPTGCHAGPPGV